MVLEHKALCLVLHRLDHFLLFIQLPHQILYERHQAEYLWHPAVAMDQSLHPLTQFHILPHITDYEVNLSGNNTQILSMRLLFIAVTIAKL